MKTSLARHQQNWPCTCHCRYQRWALQLLLWLCFQEWTNRTSVDNTHIQRKRAPASSPTHPHTTTTTTTNPPNHPPTHPPQTKQSHKLFQTGVPASVRTRGREIFVWLENTRNTECFFFFLQKPVCVRAFFAHFPAAKPVCVRVFFCAFSQRTPAGTPVWKSLCDCFVYVRHTTTHHNAPQPTTTHHNTPRHITTQPTTTHRDTSQHTATHHNTTHHTMHLVRSFSFGPGLPHLVHLLQNFHPKNWISHLDKTFHTVQPRSKLSLSCGPKRKDAKTCLACRSTFCTPRAGTFAHLPVGQRQGARLLDGISAWLSQSAHLRPRQVSASSRRYWSRPRVSWRPTNNRRRQRAPTWTRRAHNHEPPEQCVHASSNQQKTYELDTWANYRSGAAKKFMFVCFFAPDFGSSMTVLWLRSRDPPSDQQTLGHRTVTVHADCERFVASFLLRRNLEKLGLFLCHWAIKKGPEYGTDVCILLATIHNTVFLLRSTLEFLLFLFVRIFNNILIFECSVSFPKNILIMS